MNVIGVDPSSKSMAMAGMDEGVPWAHKIKRPRGLSDDWPGTLMWFFEQLTDHSEWPWRYYPGPLAVFVEQPLLGRGGVRSTIKVSQAAAIPLLAAVACGVDGVYEVNVQSWKKQVVGKGNASKDDVKAWLRVNHPERYAFTGGDQDLIDATCIYLYGESIVGAGSRVSGALAEGG